MYDKTGDEVWYEVEVVRPIEEGMGMEVVCPPVVTPGEFFVCTADIPLGSDLTFSLAMSDDLINMVTDSGTLNAPEQFMHIPGGPLKTASYNISEDFVDDMTSKYYILQSTYFRYMTNLTGIYYVPASTGEILFEVIKA